jgi:hypothetical protein
MITMYGASVEMPYESPMREESFTTEELRDQWVELMEVEYAEDLENNFLYISKWERPLFESMEEYAIDRAKLLEELGLD